MKLVYTRNVPGFLSSSKVAEILKDRFNNAYHKYLYVKCCIVREAFGDALVECSNEEEFMTLACSDRIHARNKYCATRNSACNKR
jgi:hypothetical protein